MSNSTSDLTRNPAPAEYVAHLQRQMLSLNILLEGATYTVTYRPGRMFTALAAYQAAGDESVPARLRYIRSVLADVRRDGLYIGRVDRLATTSPLLLVQLAEFVGQHFEQWNPTEAQRFYGEGLDA